MRTKIVYCLTSTPADHYLEQTYISACSCRLYNKEAHIVLVNDTATQKYCLTKPWFLSIFDEIISIDASAYKDNGERNRFLKTTLRQSIDGDYLYIDGDTLICSDLGSIDFIEADFAAVLDFHLPISARTPAEQEIIKGRIGQHLASDKYFNGGVSFCRDNKRSHDFFSKWHSDWEKHLADGSYIDQPPLYRALANSPELKVKELDGSWNCQIVDNGLKFLSDARIVHIFGSTGSNIHKLFTPETYAEIRANNGLTERIKLMLEHPKMYFADIIHLCNAHTTGIIYSDSFGWLSDAYYNHPTKYKCFRIIKRLLSLF